MWWHKLNKRYFPISFYLYIFVLLAIAPAGITTYLSINNAYRIQRQAEEENIHRANTELRTEVHRLSDDLLKITANLAGWDETRALFVDATYYNYWRDIRVKDLAQASGILDAADLYRDNGAALTSDYILTPQAHPVAIAGPAVMRQAASYYLVYFQPITVASAGKNRLLGYVGARMNLDAVTESINSAENSHINKIEWMLPSNEPVALEEAIRTARLDVAAIPEIKEFSDIIRTGFTEFLLYTLTLIIFWTVLLSLSVARPLGRLAKYLQDVYSGHADTIPVNFHGVIKIRELEDVREAINDYKHRFQSATKTLEEKNKELMHLTYHDPLTGRYNRRAFTARLEHALETAVIENKQHALCYIDMDQFKIVNDTCGHVAGDELLKQVAMLLESEIRDSDMLARLGGDEFGVLLEGCNLDKAEEVAEAMRQKVKTHRFIWHDKPFDIGISIGLVPITADNANIGEIWRNADAACYVAKDSGRNRLHIYQEHDTELVQRYGEMQWVSRLKQALDENRFVLYAQLIKPLHPGDNSQHYEVLLRLREGNGDLILPMAFIPAAERYNEMPYIDRWVIENTLRHFHNIKSHHGGKINLSINLSGQSIGNQEVLELIKNSIDTYNIDPRQLCFEITETAAMSNLADAMHFIHSLRSLGCRFSLDDFGSGLSSFGYLSNLEVDYIKIYGEFIRNVSTDALSRTIVGAINQIGHVMGVKTIAEFVENEALVKPLTDLGIDYIQGIAIHKPAPLSELFAGLSRVANSK